MKKFLAVSVLALALTACGGDPLTVSNTSTTTLADNGTVATTNTTTTQDH
jgi:ABC-type glycerol-3-phosphate transport system substrate-binding protein